jgi:hypothetical protein
MGWHQPPSAEQSPVDVEKYKDVYELSVAVTGQMEAFLQAATAHLMHTDPSPSKEFIEKWRAAFEECLQTFRVDETDYEEDASSEHSRDGNGAASVNTANESTLRSG